jgi:triacylglycerol lipase
MSPSNFDPQATTFSLPNAQLLGQAAAVSYEDPARCRQWANARGFDEDFDFFTSTGVVPHSDTQGFVAQNSRAVLLVFRGTQPNVPVDWLSDFEASHETWGHPVGTVHKGFYEALRAVWGHPLADGREILPARLLNRGDRALWIAGHSLGGALAELAAAQASFVCHIPVQGVYTFGQPRCGDDAFAAAVHAALGNRIFRFINDRDIVPRVPFFGMGFRHYGSEVFFDHAQKQNDGQPSVENLAAALRLALAAADAHPVDEASKMLADAVKAAGFHGNVLDILHQAVKVRESIAAGAAKDLLATGTENIEDHDMRKCYLARLGTSLVLGQTA